MTEKTPAPPPAPVTAPAARLLPWLGLGCVVIVCFILVAGFVGLNALGIVSTQINLFRNATPTTVAVANTSTPTTAPPATLAAGTDTPTVTAPTQPPMTVDTVPTQGVTPVGTRTYIAWDARLSPPCDLFEGENDVRKYGCENGQYVMLNKQATTRYAYYDVPFGNAVIEGRGHFMAGTGKYEYGLVFRANTDGSEYYVFTVTDDGKYNASIYKDDKYTDLIPYTKSPAVNTGTTDNLFKVVTQGPEFSFYLNDIYIGGVNDPTIQAGDVGFFFYNAQPNATVAFDKLTVSTFNPPTPAPPTTGAPSTPSSAEATPVPLPTNDSGANAVPTTAPTAGNVAPGVYVTNLRYAPGNAKRKQPITFFPTFLNTTGRPQGFNWSVEIWENDPSKKNSFGIADGTTNTIPTGTHELATSNAWQVGGGGPCMDLRARVIFEDDQSRRVPFKRPNGSDLWLPLRVCP